MKHEPLPNWGRPLLAAFALAILAVFHPAHGECLSPSTPAGATTTTVYRCPELDPSAGKQPALGTTGKTTVVERGSADVPWFEPQSAGNKVDAAKMPAAKIEATSAPDKKIETVKAPEKIEAASAPEPEEITKVKKKATAKKKIASKKRVKKVKVARAKTTKIKGATKPAKVKTPEETPKIESTPPDEKTIVWTKKDVPLGGRIVNWLGF